VGASGGESVSFSLTIGLHQGWASSPYLFALVNETNLLGIFKMKPLGAYLLMI